MAWLGKPVLKTVNRGHGCERVRVMEIRGVVAAAQAASAPSWEPTWAQVITTIAPAVTALVAVLGGIFAYFKFFRGRIFRSRCLLSLKPQVLCVDDLLVLRVDILIKNDGQSALRLDSKYAQRLDVFIADDSVWKDAITSEDGIVLWYDGKAAYRSFDVFDDPGLMTFDVPIYRDSELADMAYASPVAYTIEAGEQLERSVITPVDSGVAYLAQLTVHACSHVGWASAVRHRRCSAHTRRPQRWQ